jgi:transcriptional regulator GlxA family with amidase domain
MLIDLGGTAETFRIANELGARYRMHFIGPAARATSSIGLDVCGIQPLPSRLPPGAIVLIPGAAHSATDYQGEEAKACAAWLGRTVTADHRLCTVCSGVFLAAQSGLLRGRTCTTHHMLTERLAREHPDVCVLENRIFVQDCNVWTSAGATTGIDLVLHLIAEHGGPKLALDVARMLVIYFRRTGADVQLSPWVLHRNHMHPALHRVQDAVIRHPARRWTLPDLAREACTSPRHLARLFQEHAGISPLNYVRKIRMAAAKEIVHGSRHSLERVAEMVGFSSGEQLRRTWQRFEGSNPASSRRKHHEALNA